MNKASVTQIAAHLRTCDVSFVPPLSGRIGIDDYAHKIADNAVRFEAWSDGELVGLVASYFNDLKNRVAFITSVCVLPRWQRRGIASQLVTRCIEYTLQLNFLRIELEVDEQNCAATSLYEKHGFSTNKMNCQPLIMYLVVG